MGRIKDRLISERQERIENAVVLKPGDFPGTIGVKIGAPHLADKEHIPGEYCYRVVSKSGIVERDRNALVRVPGGVEDFDPHVPPNGFSLKTGALWTTVNERDELGSDLVPDYMTTVRDGGVYGWPYSYFGQHMDERVQPQKPSMIMAKE